MLKKFIVFYVVLTALPISIYRTTAVAQLVLDTNRVETVSVNIKAISDSIRIVSDDVVKRIEYYDKTTNAITKTIPFSDVYINTKICQKDFTDKIVDAQLAAVVKDFINNSDYYNLQKHIYYPLKPQIKNNYLCMAQCVSYRLGKIKNNEVGYDDPIFEETYVSLYNAQGETIFSVKDATSPFFTKTGKYIGYLLKSGKKHILFDIKCNRTIEINKNVDEIVFSKNDKIVLLVRYLKEKNDYELSVYDLANNKWELENYKYTAVSSPAFKTINIIEESNLLVLPQYKTVPGTVYIDPKPVHVDTIHF